MIVRLLLVPLLFLALAVSACVPGPGASASVEPVHYANPADHPEIRAIWNRILPRLEEALTVKGAMATAPAPSLLHPFRSDREDYRNQFEAILDGLSILLSERGLAETRAELAALAERIRGLKGDIARYREARAGAPEEHMILTTRAGYEQKIAAAEAEITRLEGEVEQAKARFAREFAQYGMELTPEQADVLLSRVDGDDIIRMALVFDTVKGITARLMELTRESGEDLEFAKKYYGMHVVLLELIQHMQGRYLHQVDHVYLPRLEQIVTRTRAVKREAERELTRERSDARRQVYRANLAAHKLTLQTADLYERALASQREKITTAGKRVARDLKLARNTLETVMVSADLLGILKTSQNTFNALMTLQVPELVPFQNLEMRRKFQELSTMLEE